MRNYPFVVRVYGLYIHPEQGLLVSDEHVFGQYITKFPGGGLEFGEGTVDCLVREMMEELGMDFQVLEHFYTTDFFVPSAFDPAIQVLSIYYTMKPAASDELPVSTRPFDFTDTSVQQQSFRYIPLDQLTPEDLTLVIDRHVVERLKVIR